MKTNTFQTRLDELLEHAYNAGYSAKDAVKQSICDLVLNDVIKMPESKPYSDLFMNEARETLRADQRAIITNEGDKV